MQNDENLWLEDVEGTKAMAWVREQNAISALALEQEASYKIIEETARTVFLAKDRLPYVSIRGGFVYNLWQDEKNVRGLWRRTTLAEFKAANPKWDIILDIDDLAKRENENWVWRSEMSFEPDYRLTLLSLSRGGGDAAVVREFDIEAKKFVDGGFFLPEAKSDYHWIDKDTIFVGTDFGPGSQTKSGYSRQVRRLKRGQAIQDAKLIYECGVDDLAASGLVWHSEGVTWKTVVRIKDFFHSDTFLFTDDGKLTPLPIPDDAQLTEVIGHQGIVKLKSAWTHGSAQFSADSVLTLNLKDLAEVPKLVYSPPAGSSIESVSRIRSGLILQILESVRSKVIRLTQAEDGWKLSQFEVSNEADFHVTSLNRYDDSIMMNQDGYLTPPSIWHADWSGENPIAEKLKSLPERFDGSRFVVEQLLSTSRDGTRITYSIIRPRDLKLDGRAPTLLYGYGGFEVSLTPSYLGSIGKIWLEQVNGVYVVANIRGGGEFGPSWHQAALQKNRQLCYDDFISIAEDLVSRKITSPRHLGIMGGSNGGLLVGAVMTQRPDLLGAVVCQVPLLDMLRYTKLLAGHSWIAEYGDPEDAEMREVILRYSPYQNIREGVKYPPVFFSTSTKDDRVHPGHARKMAARLIDKKQPVLYYENIEGGHGGAANIEQRIKLTALSWTFLSKTLSR